MDIRLTSNHGHMLLTTLVPHMLHSRRGILEDPVRRWHGAEAGLIGVQAPPAEQRPQRLVADGTRRVNRLAQVRILGGYFSFRITRELRPPVVLSKAINEL